ncbi:MAG: hypothetical protein ACI4WS_00080 [Oscillospiraceae bacterium]
MKIKEQIKENYHSSKRSCVIVLNACIVAVLFVMIRQIFLGNFQNVMLCFLSIALMIIPVFLRSKTGITLPNVLEIAVIVFVFAAEILGEIANFYNRIPIWDSILHTTTGFLAASVGFGLIDLLNTHSKRIQMTPLFVALLSFCFSMTVGVLWEFFEFSGDKLFNKDMQKDRIVSTVASVSLNPSGENKEIVVKNIDHTVLYDKDGNELAVIEGGYLDVGITDTMKDLAVNMVGAVVFSAAGFLYIHRRDKYKFAEGFIITVDNPTSADKEPLEVRDLSQET